MIPFHASARAGLLASVLVVCAEASPAQAPYRVKDIDNGVATHSLSLSRSAATGPAGVYFGAGSAVSPSQLWRSDGTATGTRKLHDLDGPVPDTFIAVPSGVFFFVGNALWKIDATGEERMLRAIPGYLWPEKVAVGDRLVFVVDDGVHGPEPWGSDGTSEGTRVLQDIEPGSEGSYPAGLRVVGDRVLFTAADRFAGAGIWRTDGTPEGTRRITTIPSQTHDNEAASTSDLYLFVASPGTTAQFAVWRSDGTAGGTFALHDFVGDYDGVCPLGCQPYGPYPFASVGNRIVFTGNDGVHGRALWSSDGTAAGTILLGPPDAGQFVRAGDWLYFTAGGFDAFDLWRTDGTAAGTSLVFQGLDMGGFRAAFPLASLGDRLVFVSGGYANLWITDGSAAGTRNLRDLSRDVYTSVDSAIEWDGALLLFATGELWRTDGTAEGTTLVTDFPTGASSFPVPERDIGGRLLFQAGRTALWRSDGTEAGTVELRRFHALADPTVPGSGTAAFRGATYFAADDGEHGTELWRTDGTPEGTQLVTDRFSGGDVNELVALPDRLVFRTWDQERGAALLATDGTPTGTEQISTYAPQSDPVVLGGLMIYTTIDYNTGTELWRSDGTAAGTYRIAALHSGPGGQVGSLARLGDRAFFTANDATRWGLWSTDGTSSGTRLVRAFAAPFGYDLVAAGGLVFFTSEGYKLWRSDGTEAGTIRIAVLPVAPIASLQPAGGRVFFTASDGVHGTELWTSDGTSTGTGMVADLRPGADGSSPAALASVAGRVLFSASDGVHGYEPWVSDGTAAGTRMLADVAPGLPSSGPQQFTLAGGLVYFSADDGVTGRELWAIPLEAAAGTARAPVPVERAPVAPRDLPPRP